MLCCEEAPHTRALAWAKKPSAAEMLWPMNTAEALGVVLMFSWVVWCITVGLT